MNYPISPDCVGAIYIFTNPIFNCIKIGYATDVERRRSELSCSTSIPLDFEVYAYYDVEVSCSDKILHSLISLINPELRINPKKEFFNITANEGYLILQKLAQLSGTENRLHLINDIENSDIPDKKIIKSRFRFDMADIPYGEIINFDSKKAFKCYQIPEEETNISAVVIDDKNISINGKTTTTSGATKEILSKYINNISFNGYVWWTYRGESLWDRRMRMEQDGTYGKNEKD